MRDLVWTGESAAVSRRVTLYSLRHTFGSSHAAAGMALKIDSVMMGHSNIVQTADTYMHADGTVTAEWMQRFQEALAAASAPKARAPLN